MNNILEKDIPENILKFINLQASWLIRTGNFSPQDREDIAKKTGYPWMKWKACRTFAAAF